MVHSVRRSHIYDDVIKLYTEMCSVLVNEYPFFVQFCDELAVDTGGVTRDMFSAFFDDLYLRLFDGSSLLYPAVHASIDVNDFTIIGSILSHAYLIAGIFPDRIAFPCLAAAFLGPNTAIPESVLCDSFISSLSARLRCCTLCIENGQLQVPFRSST